MRIFHLSQNVYDPLPATHHTRRIWGELSKGCEQYHVIASAGRFAYSHSVEQNIHLHLLPSLGRKGWSFFFSSWFSFFLAMIYRPDSIVAQCPVNGGLAAVCLGKLLRRPVLLEIHGAHYFQVSAGGPRKRFGHRIFRQIARFTLGWATRIRTLSTDMTARVVAEFGVHLERKIAEIGNRVDLEIFSQDKVDYSSDGSFVMVSTGAFTPLKGHRVLIEHVLPSFPELRLLLIGRGPLANRYRGMAEECGVADRLSLRFAADHAEVAELLSKADFYVHSSHSEGVPRAVLEAMAMGLPVIATEVGFLGGVVDNGTDILLVPPNDPEALVNAVGRLVASAALRQCLGQAAASKIRSRFEWNTVFNQYRTLIQTMQIGRQ